MKKIFDIIYRTAAAAAAMLLAVACLEKYPSSAIPEGEAMKTFNDAEQHVNGIYASMKSAALYSGLLTLLPDLQTDMVFAVEGNTNTYGDFWRWQVRATNSEVESVYGALYAVIGNCNFYLDSVDELAAKLTDDEQIDLLDIYTGEVYAIRAMCYSELIKCFCEAFDPATAQTTPGVVLRTKYFEKEPVVRASLKESFDFIVSDLEKAEERLSDDEGDNVPNAVFVTLATAQALHARVALYMNDWETAVEYASKLINNKNYSLASVRTTMSDGASAFDFMWAYDMGSEVIWRVGFTTTSYGGALGRVFLNITPTAAAYYFFPDYVPSAQTLNSFEAGDARDDAYFADSADGIIIGYSNGMDWPLLVKYYGNRQYFVPNYMFGYSMPKPFRLAEQYLIRAEAYCRQGRYALAANDLTTLRTARFTTGGNISVNENNWLKTLADERLKELYMEGFRLNDLKRWGEEFAKTVDGEHSIVRGKEQFAQQEGRSLNVRWDDPLFVWPIPQHELEAPGANLTPNKSNR